MTLILAFLRPYLGKIIEYGLILVAVFGLYLYVKQHYETLGYNKAISEINQTNKRASDAAETARSKVEDCNTTGGDWDVSVGVCNHGRNRP